MVRETRVSPQPLGEKGQHFPLRDGLSFPLFLWSGCARGHGDSYPCVTQDSPRDGGAWGAPPWDMRWLNWNGGVDVSRGNARTQMLGQLQFWKGKGFYILG